jgi:hypothetical protein
MALALLVPFQGLKKSRFSGPTPSNAPSNAVALLKTIKYKRHKNNWYIGSFMYPSAVVCCCVLLLCVVVCCWVFLCVVVCCCMLEGWGGLLVAVLCEQ